MRARGGVGESRTGSGMVDCLDDAGGASGRVTDVGEAGWVGDLGGPPNCDMNESTVNGRHESAPPSRSRPGVPDMLTS